MDGVDITSLYSDTVQQYKNQTIMGDITFLEDVTMETDLIVLGGINDYDLQDQVDNMILITDDTIDGMSAIKPKAAI